MIQSQPEYIHLHYIHENYLTIKVATHEGTGRRDRSQRPVAETGPL